MRRGNRTEEAEVLLRRHKILDRLCQSPAQVRDLVEETDHSRSTINRAINELEEMTFVERGNEGIEATTAGSLACERFRSFLGDIDDIFTAEQVLAPLPAEAGVGTTFVAGSEPVPAADPAPYRPLERVHDELAEAEVYRALVPSVGDPRYIRVLYEHVITQENPADLVVSADVFETLRDEFPRRTAVMAESDRFSVRVGALPSFGLGLYESGDGTAAHVVVPNEGSGVQGLLANDAAAAVEWADEQYQRVREAATDRTAALIADSDGGVDALGGARFAPRGQSLPAALEREGFVSVDLSYFRDEPVADPATAWRTGLSLSEVHTGYAFDRTLDTGGGEEVDLPGLLRDRLVEGTDCAVLGPPGSGKSTVCKQVAADWYDEGRGPVLYREGGRGRPLSAVDDLVATVTSTDGHALVVVEDAVRPGGQAVFDALDRLQDADVSVLLDAREIEWREHDSSTAAELSVTHVPPMSEDECEQFVAHFERTAGRSVDVSADQLWSAVRGEAPDGAGTTHEMLRVIHRLSTYADPLADGPTALDEAVAAVYDEVRDDDLLRSRAVLANAVNAAGMDLERGLLYAGVDADQFDAVDDALARLDGCVIFSRGGDRYQPVHEAWSTRFLSHLVTAEGESTAARLFSRAVNSLLSLAADETQRERVEAHLDGEDVFAAVSTDPGAWVDSAVEAIYTMGSRQPGLAPLFGADDSVVLPAVCSDGVATRRLVWLGRLHLAGGYDDRAARAFEGLPADHPEYGPERLLGLARVAHSREEYDDGISRCRECLSFVDEGCPAIRARARLRLGDILSERGANDEAKSAYLSALDEVDGDEHRHWTGKLHLRLGAVANDQGAFDEAMERYESALAVARERNDRNAEAAAVGAIGRLAMEQSAFDRATRLLEQALDLHRALGDPRGEAETLNNLGIVASRQGNQDRARELLERCIERRTELGDRHEAAGTRHNLGIMMARTGEFDRAREQFEHSLEIKRELEDRQGEAKTLMALGNVSKLQGDYEHSRERYERTLELKRELGDRHGTATAQFSLAGLVRRQGEYERADDLFARCRDIYAELGDPGGESKSVHNLATIATRRGEYDRAERLFERSLTMKRDMGDRPGVAETLHQQALLATRRGEYERGRELGERSRQLADELDEQSALTNALIHLGINDLEQDAHDQAREHAEAALALATDVGESESTVRARRLLAELAIRDNESGRASEHLKQARDAADETHASVAPATRLTRGHLALARGDHGSAREAAREAAAEFESLGVPYWDARSRRLCGRVATAVGDRDAASDALLDALDTFTEIGATDDAFETLRLVVEAAPDATERWHSRATELLSAAPETVAARHEDWVTDLSPFRAD